MSTPTEAGLTADVPTAPRAGAAPAVPPALPPQEHRARLRQIRRRRALPGYAMLLPFAALFLGFLVWPLINALYLAFTDYNGIKPPSFVGLDNFRELWFSDPRFHTALRNTFIFVAATVAASTLISLATALAFHGTSWRDRIMRTLFFLPSVTSTIAQFVIWRWIFTGEDFGLANTVLHWFGGSSVSWLTTPRATIPILVFIAVWGGCGYGMVIFVAGLNSIPEEHYESARLDGATRWQQFRHITLPQLRPVTTYVIITGLISAFQVFESVYIVYRAVSTVGGPLDSALMIVPYLYDLGFQHFRLGMASAIAWSLFLIIFVVSMIQMRITRALKDM